MKAQILAEVKRLNSTKIMKSIIRYTGTGTFPSQKLTSLSEHL